MDSSRNVESAERRVKCSLVRCRHVLVLLVFFGFFNAFTMRVNLSVAIVAMVNRTLGNTTEAIDESDTCPYEHNNETTSEKKQGEFDWDENMQGTILGCFFYVYIAANLISGRIAEVYGVKWTFGIAIFGTAVLTMLSPIVAEWSTVAFIALRITIGAMEGVTTPAIHCSLARWFNKGERSSMHAVMSSGILAGSAIGQIVAGIVCNSDILGWPYAFYVFGIVGLVWCVFWFALMYEHPEDHPRISEEELKYISAGRDGYTCASECKPAPWRRIMTSVPVWACAFSGLGRMWSYNIITTNIPTYMKNILHYDIAQSGLLSSLPSITEFFLTILAGYVSDWILSKGLMGVTTTRKLLNSMGLAPSVICLILIPFVGCDRPVIVALLTFTSGAHGFCTVGYALSTLDMAPNYAGTLLGLINGFSQISGVLAPFTVGRLTNHRETSQQWHKIFYISAAISAFSLFTFACFGSADQQPWNKYHDGEETNSRPNEKSRIMPNRKKM